MKKGYTEYKLGTAYALILAINRRARGYTEGKLEGCTHLKGGKEEYKEGKSITQDKDGTRR